MRKSRVVLGSPPLTRGPPRSNISSNGNSRITPAHAGTTRKVNVSQSWKRDHPRSRGDHDHRDNLNIIHKGSPPLTRGPLGARTCECCAHRITPAHAGTTNFRDCSSGISADHPRSRGDHTPLQTLRVVLKGSPPLTRGPRIGPSLSLIEMRITPAHAGTTNSGSKTAVFHGDHPRSRGDHFPIP